MEGGGVLAHEFEDIAPLPEIVSCLAGEICGVHTEDSSEE